MYWTLELASKLEDAPWPVSYTHLDVYKRQADAPADSCNHQLYYTSPAAIWEETLPLGNGRLGMMPDGGILREHIVLNEICLLYTSFRLCRVATLFYCHLEW